MYCSCIIVMQPEKEAAYLVCTFADVSTASRGSWKCKMSEAVTAQQSWALSSVVTAD